MPSPLSAYAVIPVFLPAHSRSTQSRELTENAVETESRSKSLASVREGTGYKLVCFFLRYISSSIYSIYSIILYIVISLFNLSFYFSFLLLSYCL